MKNGRIGDFIVVQSSGYLNVGEEKKDVGAFMDCVNGGGRVCEEEDEVGVRDEC